MYLFLAFRKRNGPQSIIQYLMDLRSLTIHSSHHLQRNLISLSLDTIYIIVTYLPTKGQADHLQFTSHFYKEEQYGKYIVQISCLKCEIWK